MVFEKEKFINPYIEIINLNDDIICTSAPFDDDWGDQDPWIDPFTGGTN